MVVGAAGSGGIFWMVHWVGAGWLAHSLKPSRFIKSKFQWKTRHKSQQPATSLFSF
jgi:hypothetical protein